MQAYGCCPKTSPCSWSVELASPLPVRTAGAPDYICSCVTTSLQTLDLETVLSLLPIFYVDHLEAPGTQHSDSLHPLLPWPYLAASLLLRLKPDSCWTRHVVVGSSLDRKIVTILQFPLSDRGLLGTAEQGPAGHLTGMCPRTSWAQETSL